MKVPDYVCLDALTRTPRGDGWVLRGWWLAGEQPKAVVLETGDGVAAPLWLGHARDDLRQAFPDRPSAGRSGFLAWLADSSGSGDAKPPESCRWWFRDASGQWRAIPAALSDRRPQGFFPNDVPIENPPGAVNAAATRADDPETHFRIALAGQRPLTLRLDIVNKCNLRCVMCHYSEDDVFRRPARSVTPEQFETWFAPVAGHVKEVMLSCADEPLMSRHFVDIVRLLRRLAPHVAIRFCTNAMLLTPPIAQQLVAQQVDEILFSFDACTRATLERIRRGADYERVIHNILCLARLRDAAGSNLPVLGVNFVMMASNIHEAPHFVELAHRIGVATLDFRHVVKGYDRFRVEHEQLVRQPARFNHYRGGIIERARTCGIRLFIPPQLPTAESWTPDAHEPGVTLEEFNATLQRFAPPKPPDVPALMEHTAATTEEWPSMFSLFAGAFCMRPFTEIFIRDQHEVLPCPWHHRVLGDIGAGANLLDIFQGEPFVRLRRAMLTPSGDPACHGCPFKSEELPGQHAG